MSAIEAGTGGTRLRQVSGKRIAVKNKMPAPRQITAEQILRESNDIQLELNAEVPHQKITDPEELAEYRGRKRKEFEDRIRMQRMVMTNWIKYANWEESQGDYKRCRSVYERALDVDYRDSLVWLKYIDMELKHKNVNHARNVLDRAVQLLPRIDKFWLKYTYVEEMLRNYSGCRQVFERWMEWQPDEQAWNLYIKFELRHGERERARTILHKYVKIHPTVTSWMKLAKFEESKARDTAASRAVYEEAIEYLGAEGNDPKLFTAFAKFEERCKEFERARTIYRYALDHIPKSKAADLYKMFISFEKQFGDREGIEDVIVSKRRFQYEEELKHNAKNYDVWFDYIRLEETNGEVGKVREIYERSIANVPPAAEKRFWRRYIYLWINYALFEELDAKDAERARAVYKECIRIIPHADFSFSKIWIMFAHFEIRQLDTAAARSVLGHAIGLATTGRSKIFNAYIELEQKLGNIDRCRKLYEKWLEQEPHNCNAWKRFAELEASLQEMQRGRAIYELAIDQPQLDMPEMVWKAYIDFEIAQGENERTRHLYRRLLDRTKHVKVWISFAQFECSLDELELARAIFDEAYTALKGEEQREERVLLTEAWNEFEKEFGDLESRAAMKERLPTRIKKSRQTMAQDGTAGGWEEYYDYVFPDETEAQPKALKLLQMAHMWKKKKLEDAQMANNSGV
eukprot:TRINITY_DN76_c0_g1_i1.p1 TRINITY_DN76_c0_g1~~TRINITY_DN76_c0_g1_i1.p1  ORF type:complete len:687 (+),score=222.36 TRINITY_DN76_c0_g1_i1:151-2211(+)